MCLMTEFTIKSKNYFSFYGIFVALTFNNYYKFVLNYSNSIKISI